MAGLFIQTISKLNVPAANEASAFSAEALSLCIEDLHGIYFASVIHLKDLQRRLSASTNFVLTFPMVAVIPRSLSESWHNPC
jgi:hypothetical protein